MMSAQASATAEQEERKGEEPIGTAQRPDQSLKLSHNPKMWPDVADEGSAPIED